MNKKRVVGLDVAKVAACMAVTLMHTMRLVDPSVESGAVLYYLTRCAMPIFFMTAGYVRLNRDRPFGTWLAKSLKIAEVIAFWLALYAAALFAVGKRVDFRELLLSTAGRGPLGIMWFFASLAILTALTCPLNLILKRKYGYIIALALLAAVCFAVDAYNIYNIVRNGAEGFVQEAVPQSLRLWTWLLYFIIGGALNKTRAEERLPNGLLAALTIVFSLAAVAYMYGMCKCATSVVNGEYMYDSPVVAVWCVFVLLCFLRLSSETVGKLAYALSSALVPVCVVHYPILKNLAEAVGKISLGGQLLLWLSVTAVCFAGGIAMSKIPVLKNFAKF